MIILQLLFLTMLDFVLAAIKTICINRIQAGRLKLRSIDLLLCMSSLVSVYTLIYSYVTDDMK
ncbi:hypothetical protein J3Q64DRAFT_1728147 [Phycomyces blakesleeanus]|uniref:Uncharacterized protein n=1 Tax=Phycomyces blakesleeanus TaxID=4837 RepID=A0ABR3B481_PHYBL